MSVSLCDNWCDGAAEESAAAMAPGGRRGCGGVGCAVCPLKILRN